MRTFSPKAGDIQRQWHVIDASDVILGRLASQAAILLRGKHKPIFAPHVDTGDFVIVVNADKVALSGNKLEDKRAYRHSGYPGGLRSVAYRDLMEKNPERAVEKAVRGMLPKNTLGRQMLRKLKVYAGPEHPHRAQQPVPFEITQVAQQADPAARQSSREGSTRKTSWLSPLTCRIPLPEQVPTRRTKRNTCRSTPRRPARPRPPRAGAARKPVVTGNALGTGRRKEAIARVRIVPGTGKWQINDRSLDEYFPNKVHQQLISEPFVTLGADDAFDVVARITGGGVTGQAGALRLGIARALILVDSENRPSLKRAGFLTRDARVKERKKAGLKKARKAPQYSKR